MSLLIGMLVAVAPPASGTPLWSIAASPNSVGSPNDNLYGVSCHTTTSCFAVGWSGSGHGDDTLIERYA